MVSYSSWQTSLHQKIVYLMEEISPTPQSSSSYILQCSSCLLFQSSTIKLVLLVRGHSYATRSVSIYRRGQFSVPQDIYLERQKNSRPNLKAPSGDGLMFTTFTTETLRWLWTRLGGYGIKMMISCLLRTVWHAVSIKYGPAVLFSVLRDWPS
jgi:hypothetical protein